MLEVNAALTTDRNTRLTLVSMPWNNPSRPSIQIGALSTYLRSQNVPVTTLSLYVDWFDFLAQKTGFNPQRALDFYIYVAERLYAILAGDWIFADAISPGFRCDEYMDLMLERGVSWENARTIAQLRDVVPEFVDHSCAQILNTTPSIVGFTTTFSQTVASLAVARRIKELSPDVAVILGGSNCDGPMGAALIDQFGFIDAAVSGEGEETLLSIVRNYVPGEPIQPARGVAVQGQTSDTAISLQHPGSMNGLQISPSVLDYDDYFNRVNLSPNADALRRECVIPIEMSRGCWWGERHHCTFCGLNGSTMPYRKKASTALAAQLDILAERYGVLDFYAVDNILGMEHLRDAIPQLTRKDNDYRIFFEVKANLRRDQLETMRAAGIYRVQPGIESLSTEVLRATDKGTTAFRNVQFLINCVEIGMETEWNVILGLPCETPHALQEAMDLIPSLTHLPPPNRTILRLERFSPYFERPTEYGIRVTGPRVPYRYVYDVSDSALSNIAYFFEGDLLGDTSEGVELRARLGRRIDIWRKTSQSNVLELRRGPRLVVIKDERCGLPQTSHVYRGSAADLYLETLHGTSMSKLASAAREAGLTPSDATTLLDEWIAKRLVYREGNSLIGLAISPGQQSITGTKPLAAKAQRPPALAGTGSPSSGGDQLGN